MPDHTNPIISIITASLNSHGELLKTYKSIMKSSYKYIEWIIVDGGSRDETFNFLKENNFPKWIHEKDTGIYDAWNKGLKIANGDWIMFLGAGDLLNTKWIEKALKACSKISNLEIIYGDQEFIDNNGLYKGKRKGIAWPQAINKLKFSMCLPHSGMLHHKSLFKANSFDDSFKIVGDWKFFLDIKLKNGFYISDSIMTNILIGGISARSNAIHTQYNEYLMLLNDGLAKKHTFYFLKWKFKIFLSNFTRTFNLLQKLWMRI